MKNQNIAANKDLDMFFNDEDWKRFFAKRIENKKGKVSWEGATFNKSPTIVQKLFMYTSASKNELNLTEQLINLEKDGYKFSSSDFVPGVIVDGSVNSKFATAYIELFEFLESRNIKVNQRTQTKLLEVFQYTFNNELIQFLSKKGFDNEFSSVKKLAQRLSCLSTPFMLAMNLITKDSNGNLSPRFLSGDKEQDNYSSQALIDQVKKEEYELNFLLDYFANKNLSTTELQEVIDGFTPDYMARQKYMFSCMTLADAHEKLIEADEKIKPREVFNDSQLKLIDLLQNKYKVKIVKSI